MKNLNNITNIFYSDEWFTDRDIVELLVKELGADFVYKTVLCPYDTYKSEFVKVAYDLNAETVIYNIRDFLTNEYKADFIITNPPFSIKDEVIEKCLKSGVPTALILPLDSLGGVKRHKLYKEYNVDPYVIIPNRRINYSNSDSIKMKSAIIHSIIMIFNTEKRV